MHQLNTSKVQSIFILSLVMLLFIMAGCSSDENNSESALSPQVLWTKVFGNDVINEGWSVAVGPSGNIFVSGFYDTPTGSDALQLLKYDSSGTLLNNYADTAVAYPGVDLVCAQDGSLYVTYHDNLGDRSTHIRKYDSGFSFQWDQTLDSGAYNESVHDMELEGNLLYIVGTINGNAYGYTGGDYHDLLVGCYNLTTKSWEWQTVLDGSDADSDWDYGAGIAIDNDYIYVTGVTDGDLDGSGNNTTTPFIGKFAKSTGAKQWVVVHQDAGGKGIAIDESGNFYVTGDAGVAKFDSSGNYLSKKIIVGESNETESGNAIVRTPSGYLVMTGEVGDGNTSYLQTIDAYLSVFNSNADSVLWSGLYGDPSLDSSNLPARDEGHALALAADGSVYVVGQTASTSFNGITNPGGSGNYDIFIMKLKLE